MKSFFDGSIHKWQMKTKKKAMNFFFRTKWKNSKWPISTHFHIVFIVLEDTRVHVAEFLVLCVMFCRSLFVLLAIVLSVILRFKVSDFPLGIFKRVCVLFMWFSISYWYNNVVLFLFLHESKFIQWLLKYNKQNFDWSFHVNFSIYISNDLSLENLIFSGHLYITYSNEIKLNMTGIIRSSSTGYDKSSDFCFSHC